MADLLRSGSYLALEPQAKRLAERRNAQNNATAFVCGREFAIMPGVYATGVDTELMLDSVKLEPGESFIEIGCGSGAVSLLLAKRGAVGVATDINPQAIANARLNAERFGLTGIEFVLGHAYAGVERVFDAIVCNPPYNNHAASDFVDRMFWDPQDVLKRDLFAGARIRLRTGGRLYLGWADFSDIDQGLPLTLAREHNFELISTFSRPSHSGKCIFSVLVFRPV